MISMNNILLEENRIPANNIAETGLASAGANHFLGTLAGEGFKDRFHVRTFAPKFLAVTLAGLALGGEAAAQTPSQQGSESTSATSTKFAEPKLCVDALKGLRVTESWPASRKYLVYGLKFNKKYAPQGVPEGCSYDITGSSKVTVKVKAGSLTGPLFSPTHFTVVRDPNHSSKSGYSSPKIPINLINTELLRKREHSVKSVSGRLSIQSESAAASSAENPLPVGRVKKISVKGVREAK
jgi:hypothetical protein